MTDISRDKVDQAIQTFLSDQINKKIEPEVKKLEKAQAMGNITEIEELEKQINEVKEKYDLNTWIADAANRMSNQLRFGTHISKGIHPDSKGDNINFQNPQKLPEKFVGSQSIAYIPLDANGNAAALPLASFFNTPIEGTTIKLRDLIQQEHPALKGCFANDPKISDDYAYIFKATLDNKIETPKTDARNKQLLWPADIDTIDINGDDYICLVPLHPSALVNQLHQKISKKYSEENKQARDSSKKKNNDNAQAYISINNLAVLRLGGTKPQNISQLTSSQGGRNYLLPSLPPQIVTKPKFHLSRNRTSIFNKNLNHYCYYSIQDFFSVIKEQANTVDIRTKRKEALEGIINKLFEIADYIQSTYEPGWSKNYELAWSQKYWLDPERALLTDEEKFRTDKESTDWISDIEHDFASWINSLTRKQFPQSKEDIADPEYAEWRKILRRRIKASEQKNEGVFS
ncbi:MAG: type I-F CRISPR-associated protein Csy1 [Advenella sp.]